MTPSRADCDAGAVSAGDHLAVLGEVCRVARGGYLEFPTVYYDYLYDFPEHVTGLLYRDGVIHWLPKAALGIPRFRPGKSVRAPSSSSLTSEPRAGKPS